MDKNWLQEQIRRAQKTVAERPEWLKRISRMEGHNPRADNR